MCSGRTFARPKPPSLDELIAGIGLVLASATSIAMAQSVLQPRYKFIDLGVLPGGTESRAWAINQSGQIVGQSNREVNSVQQIRPFIWLYNSAYGLSAQQMHDISVVVDEAEPGIAWDINNAGLTVGQTGGATSTSGEAVTWDVDGVSRTLLGTLGGSWSIAFGINDDSPALVVGQSETNSDECGQQENDPTQLGFKVTASGGTMSTLDHVMGQTPEDQISGAFDINADSTPQAVGFSHTCTGASGSCSANRDAAEWTTSSAAGGLSRLEADAGFGGEARAINEAGSIVGWAFEDLDQSQCRKRAVFWEDDAVNPVNLHVSPLESAFDTRAEGINELDPPLIVGTIEGAARALLWEFQGSSWNVVDLNLVIGDCSADSTGDWELEEASSINDNGWIVGSAFNSDIDERRAFLLIPLACPADIYPTCASASSCGCGCGDGTVGSGDLGELLANWGACVGCCADLAPVGTGNGTVNVADLGQLNANWGDCEESLMGGGGDEVPAALASALATCGFESPQDFLNWSESASEEDIDAMGYLLQVLLIN